MNDPKILVLNLDPTPCLEDTCDRLSEFIRRSFSNAEICYSTSVPPTVSDAFMPDIVFIHPGLTTTSPEVIGFLKQTWQEVSILGIFCARGYSPIQKDYPMLHKFDDFLFSPFQERDVDLRLHKILLLKRKGTAVSESLQSKTPFHVHGLIGQSNFSSRLLKRFRSWPSTTPQC